MRLIDADEFAKTLRDISKRQKYEELLTKKDGFPTVADVIEAICQDLDGTAIYGFKNAPTVEPKAEWIPINEETIKILQDRYYYLVAHKDYTTPLKAKFYKDLPPYFKVCTFNGNFVIFIFSEEYCEITHAMKLPELPIEEEGEE